MKMEKIKPIPKYMLKLIKKRDEIRCFSPNGKVRFFSYLTKNDGELVQVTVAVRHRYNDWYCKQVVIHGIGSDICFLKDIMYSSLSGYHVGWYDEGLQKERKWYESEEWDWQYDKYFNIHAPVINPEYVLTLPEFKYSAADQYEFCDILKYLRLYRRYPEAEYVVKMGLSFYATSKIILSKLHKDVAFRKWLFKHRKELVTPNGFGGFYGYYVETVLTAYKEQVSLQETQRFLEAKKSFIRDMDLRELREEYLKEFAHFNTYCKSQHITYDLYNDYYRACKKLGLNMQESKNRYPHDFMRWHDIRIDEYKTAKAKEKMEEQIKLLEQFATVAKKYIGLQFDGKENYIVIIPRDPIDLVNEGNILHHCVGKMNYDQKFIREESLIFFIRSKEKPDVPFVTMEYSIDRRKILQCYAENNTQPEQTVLDFVHKKWLPYAKRQLKKIA